MTIFWMYAQRLIKNKLFLILLVVVPSLLLSFITTSFQGGLQLHVGVVDLDQTPLTRMLMEEIGTRATVVEYAEGELETNLVRQRIDYGITIPFGFTQRLIDGVYLPLEAVSLQETNLARPVTFQISGFLNAALAFANGDAGLFYDSMEQYLQAGFQINHQRIDDTGAVEDTVQGIGFLVLSMLFLSSIAAYKIVDDKRSYCLHRLLAAPLTVKSYTLQTIGCFVLIAILQVVGILLIMNWWFHLSFGPNPGLVLAVLIVYAVVAVAFGVALSSIAKNQQQVGVLSSLLITPMAMLGGCFWPRWIMPNLLQEIGKFVPTTWVIEGATKAIYGASVTGVGLEIGVLIVFAVVFFLLGSWKRVDIAA